MPQMPGSSLAAVGRSRSARAAACIAVFCSFTLPASAAFAQQSAAAPATAPASLEDDVAAAKRSLAAAARAVEAAEAAMDAASARLPEANQALAAARTRAAAAEQVQAAAVAAARAAQEAVDRQREQVAAAQREMDALKLKIGALARQAYISGNEYGELDILLESQDPAEFASQLAAMRQISRGNAALFTQLTALQEALAARLAELRDLEEQAADREREASDKAAQAAAARDAATAARDRIASLIEQREAALRVAVGKRAEQKALYEKLQAKLEAASGLSKVVGTQRSAREAVAWAMQYVGSGESYDGLCLGFVDDAYSPSGSRMPTAISQWYRAKAAGFGHPGDRNPPVGAHVFWLSGNPAKHVAIYAGGGMVISTGADGGRVGLVPMEYLDSYGPYIGWASPYYG